jgi:hypothetical protein
VRSCSIMHVPSADEDPMRRVVINQEVEMGVIRGLGRAVAGLVLGLGGLVSGLATGIGRLLRRLL